MILVDREMERRQREGNPILVAMVGAGYIGQAIALEIITGIVGMRLVAVANRTLARAEKVLQEAGADSVQRVETVAQLEAVAAKNGYACTDDLSLVCKAGNIDAVIEVTGTVEVGAGVAKMAIEHGKHVILANAELDATLGPILKMYADRAGVIYTDTDGDEPAVAMNLYRFVKGIGYHPVGAGNIKGFLNRYRTPDTQQEIAAKNNQNPRQLTSFADGTKLSMEATVLANATGFRVGQRGMYGPECKHVKDVVKLLPSDQLLHGGLVDYVLGAEPGMGAFVIGYSDHPVKQRYMRVFKMGDGPFYLFYTPFHLLPLELPNSISRAVLFKDAAVTPAGKPVCDVAAFAKRDLKAGEVLDGIGGFTCYGMIDNAEVVLEQGLLPMGVSEGCILNRDIRKDEAIPYESVTLPPGRLADRMRAEQQQHFFGKTAGPAAARATLAATAPR